ncbi:hypothetical protein OG978_17100 [Streptomyces sp. NBC_01591]|uniref:hypothetical protein n=1 Tax=Streptomyces sp. NBC_01591 TaxID=2975888 RepID=UPI002DD93EA9|nr:hypothetical protein [Streptomyces sp. NBC_01591]WSD68968.1 hypothetical protein OG978_17100 [Streptomyces sp. NBC_01591]
MHRLPSPRFRRIAKLVAIDSAHRIALLPRRAGHRTWVLPQRCTRLDETYGNAVALLCQDLLASYPIRLGTVTGRRWAPAPEGLAPRAETRFYIVRVDAEPADEGPGGRALWAPRAVLGLWLGRPDIETVNVLADGYLDGWLPDGPITLD